MPALDITSLDLEETALHVLQAYPAVPVTPPADSPEEVAAQIEFLGGATAALTISASPAAAAALAVAFFGNDGELTTADLFEAVKESTNVIGGAIKPLFGVITTLAQPTTDIDVSGSWTASATISYCGGTLDLSLRRVES